MPLVSKQTMYVLCLLPSLSPYISRCRAHNMSPCKKKEQDYHSAKRMTALGEFFG